MATKVNTTPTSVGEYLVAYGYSNVAEWAEDSGYEYRDDIDHWVDDEGHLVDVYGALVGVIETMLYDDAMGGAWRSV